MDREFHLRFCSLCTNRHFNKDKGLICSITKKQADFEDNCNNFHLDDNEYKRIIVEKIQKYGLTEKKGIIKKLLGEITEYEVTKVTKSIKPNCEKDLPSSTYVGKSYLNYGLGILAIIFLMVFGFINTEFKGFDLIVIGVNAALIGVITWLVIDFKTNKNDFTISEHGINKSGNLIPWKIILCTLIRKVPSKSFSEYYLILIVGTREDIEINLTGLKYHFDRVGNLVELYKERNKSRLHNVD
ncbi:MAG TPA: hypothetical protein PLM56_01790 [Cyclobacteriaceae bacterium]|jgi:uncharacterized membrane-anchored protein|nr:hypothetical protein [Cytophagales bacterium]HRE66107.1 hypothetical protein [Cyclobacteriaceae bacterium]HRF32202.1 hypothetical protein [Cyclobacteriaceae bacterium]